VPRKNKPGTLLLKKELQVGEINDLISGYVLHRYANDRVRELNMDKFIVRFEYKLPPGKRRATDTMVIVEVHAPQK